MPVDLSRRLISARPPRAGAPQGRGSSISTRMDVLLNERLDIGDGRVAVPARIGISWALPGQARDWALSTQALGADVPV